MCALSEVSLWYLPLPLVAMRLSGRGSAGRRAAEVQVGEVEPHMYERGRPLLAYLCIPDEQVVRVRCTSGYVGGPPVASQSKSCSSA